MGDSGPAGAGYFGRLHASKLAAHPDVELVAVADPDTGRARNNFV